MSLKSNEVIQKVQEIIKKKAPKHQYEISHTLSNTSLLRFAQSKIHQNNHSELESVKIKLALEKKVSNSTVNNFSESSLEKTVDELIEVVEKLPNNPEFIGFPEKIESTTSLCDKSDSFDQFCNEASDCVKTIFEKANKLKNTIILPKIKLFMVLYSSLFL